MKLTRKKIIIYGMAFIIIFSVFLAIYAQKASYKELSKMDWYGPFAAHDIDMCPSAQYYLIDYSKKKQILITGSRITNIEHEKNTTIIRVGKDKPQPNQGINYRCGVYLIDHLKNNFKVVGEKGTEYKSIENISGVDKWIIKDYKKIYEKN